MKTAFPSSLAAALFWPATWSVPLLAATVGSLPGELTATRSANNLVLSFPTTSTNYYGLQTTPDLSQSWTNIAAGIRGNGFVQTTALSNVMVSGHGFYRLTLQPAPMALSLPQGIAFAIVGYDCGGIKEQVAVSGFDPATGYPTGNVYLSTSCNGSGRGSHPTLHTGSATVVWDFAGNVISYTTPAAGSAGGPGVIATDVAGDIIYNAGANAYLIVPVPAAPAGVTAIQSGDQFNVFWTPTAANPLAIISSTLTATPVNPANALTTTVTGPATNGIIPLLQPQTLYQITIVNSTIGGPGPASAPITVMTHVASVAPSAPTNVAAIWSNPDPTASNPLATNDLIIATWSAAVPGDSPVDQYRVVVTPDDGTASLTNLVSGVTLTTYFNVNFTPNWRTTVQAHNAFGWGTVSAIFNLGGL